MKIPEHPFTGRQFMINPDYELYHYRNMGKLEVDLHHHDFYEIYLFLSGNVEYFVEGKTYSLVPGDILLINCNELHRPEISPDTLYERLVVFIRPEFVMSRSSDGANLTACFHPLSKDGSHLIHPGKKMFALIKDVLAKIFSLQGSPAFGADVLKEIYITEFLVYINQCFLGGSAKLSPTEHADRLIDKIIRFIHEHIKEELTLETIAQSLFLSKFYLSHYFKQKTGIPLYRYIKYKRLLMGRSLLRSGYSVTEAYQECGFGDYNNFIRAFKELYGISPKKYSQSIPVSDSILE